MMIVAALGGTSGSDLSWAYKGQETGWTWVEGVECQYDGDVNLGIPAYSTLFDPSIAYDAQQNEFLIAVAAKRGAGGGQVGTRIVVARFDPATLAFAWTPVSDEGLGGFNKRDKPFLVAGWRNEFYLFWFHEGSSYQYRRTASGGHDMASWQGGYVATNTGFVPGWFSIQPTVDGVSRVYAAYRTTQTATKQTCFGFLAGRDNGPPGDPMLFWEIENEQGQPIGLTLEHHTQTFGEFVPNGAFPGGQYTIQVAIDPTNHDRFFAAYHDVDCVNGTKLSVWLNVIEYQGNGWTIRPRVRVSRFDPGENCMGEPHFDQWLPIVVADTDGAVHVAYFDDTGYVQTDNGIDPEPPRFDFVWSKSCNVATSPDPIWQHTVIQAPTVPPSPFLDVALGYDTPRDFLAMTFRMEPDGTVRLAAAAPGTDPEDCAPDRSVIYVASE